ncbi:MAG: DUF4313 domain-containing protein [Coriobacteriales bacterium]|nr:DUF4313 domain-containing protein [Coriobacteriales bacterium]
MTRTETCETRNPRGDQIMKTFDYKDQWGGVTRVRLVRGAYADGSLAVQALREGDGYWEPYATLTVNLRDERSQNASYAYADANSMPTAAELLVENGLAAYTGMTRSSGFCTYPLYAFTSEFFEACADSVEEVQSWHE